MPIEKKYPEGTGLEFFGRVSASISHEIKNVLAIINENAGLLEDLVLMVEKGVPLAPERLDRLAGTVRKQILRADSIVKKMNQFSHSVDIAVDRVDLYETACFLTDLCERMISLKRVSVQVIPPASAVTVNTHRFYLQNMVWGCIEFIMEVGKPGQEIQIAFEKIEKGAEIRFGYEAVSANESSAFVLPDSVSALMKYLRAEIDAVPESGEIRIRLPEEIRYSAPAVQAEK